MTPDIGYSFVVDVFVLVLLSAHVERFSVSCMQDLLAFYSDFLTNIFAQNMCGLIFVPTKQIVFRKSAGTSHPSYLL